MSAEVFRTILERIRALQPEERVALADEVDRLTWRDRVEALIAGIRGGNGREARMSDEEIDGIVDEVRSETPLYERYWTRQRRSAPGAACQRPAIRSWRLHATASFFMVAIDMLTLAFKDRYDSAILVSSDADYKHAIEAIKFETGKTVELHQVVGSRAYDLITAASVYRPISADTISGCLRT